jgi:hypothetical protein
MPVAKPAKKPVAAEVLIRRDVAIMFLESMMRSDEWAAGIKAALATGLRDAERRAAAT